MAIQRTDGELQDFSWVCGCDSCGVKCRKKASNPGDAADSARQAGFTTLPGSSSTDPSVWICDSCRKSGRQVDFGKVPRVLGA